MNYCRKCQSDYQQPGTCNCFAPLHVGPPLQVMPGVVPIVPTIPWVPVHPTFPPCIPWYQTTTVASPTTTTTPYFKVIGIQ